MQKIWSKLVIPALGSAESNLHTTPCTIFPTQISEKYSAIVQQCTTCRQDKSGTWVVFLCFCVGAYIEARSEVITNNDALEV